MLKIFIIGTDELISLCAQETLSERHYNIVAKAKNLKDAMLNYNDIESDIIILLSQLYKRSDLEYLYKVKQQHASSRWLAIVPIVDVAYLPFVFTPRLHGYLSTNSSELELVKALHTVAENHYYISDDLCKSYALDLDFASKPVPSDVVYTFSKREAKIAWLIVHGFTLEDIAKKLEIKSTTVSSYRSRILEKVNKIRGINNNTELTRFIFHYDLLPILEKKFSEQPKHSDVKI